MNFFHIAIRSASFFWRMNLTIALGVAAAVAVLVGALLVGDSMRGSLRDITLDRLGQIDDLLTSDHFFREALATELLSEDSLGKEFRVAIPAIVLPATTVEYRSDGQLRRSVDVTLYAVPDAIWQLQSSSVVSLQAEHAIVNQQLADELSLDAATGSATARPKITIRVTARQQLSSDSALGKKEGLVQTLPEIDVVQVIPNQGMGRFGLRPTQMVPHNVFVSLSWLQQQLGPELFKGKADFQQANLIFLQRRADIAPTTAIDAAWPTRLRPTLDDLGLRLTHVARRFQPEATAEPQLAYEYFSLSSDGLVFGEAATRCIQRCFPDTRPIFTYLANKMQLVRDGHAIGDAIPFSMISGLNWDEKLAFISASSGRPMNPLAQSEIVLNEWSANDLDAIVGDSIRLTYFEPEAAGGEGIEQSTDLVLVDIAKLTRPTGPYNRRGGRWIEAKFDQRPTAANDPDFTPLVPGLTDAESIESWSLPFDTPGIRSVDDEYWKFYRTTPKAFVSLPTAQRLWNSRFGQVTSFRFEANAAEEEIRRQITSSLQPDCATFGLNLVPIRANGLRAAVGATPFDLLFLALSMFVMVSALILVTLLIRLAIQQRANQLGILTAVGFGFPKVTKIWLAEMFWVCSAGAVLGAGLGLGYAQLMLWGLRTWWVGAIRTPFIRLHISPTSLVLGTAIGFAIGMLTVIWTLWLVRRNSAIRLLAGHIEPAKNLKSGTSPWSRIIGWVLVIAAVASLVAAMGQGGEAQAGLFFGGGFCTLAALLVFVRAWLRRPTDKVTKDLRLTSLALLNARRNPLRSALTIGLVAVASFLIAAISAFRIVPDDSGTGGFDFIATSNQPLFANLNSSEGRSSLLLEPDRFPVEANVVSFRLKSGDDASCTNPFQAAQPRVIGVPQSAIALLGSPTALPFSWSGMLSPHSSNPWSLLDGSKLANDSEPIPAIIDKNTAWYSLKIFQLGTTFSVEYDSGERVTFRLVGLLNNTILQGSILVSESDFTRAFPSEVGYRYFLIQAPPDQRQAVLSQLENDLADQGFDGRDAREFLAELLAVQNTYLSTFQALGALGLLLGTFGLSAVQLRNVLERRRELALLRAIGFHESKLVRLVFLESFFLLVAGLVVGLIAAVVAVLPHFVFGNATIPWLPLAVVFLVILAMGWLTVRWASRSVLRAPLLAALREN